MDLIDYCYLVFVIMVLLPFVIMVLLPLALPISIWLTRIVMPNTEERKIWIDNVTAATNFLVRCTRQYLRMLLRILDFIVRNLGLITIAIIRRMNKKESSSSSSRRRLWSNDDKLPEDIMQLILERLRISDCLRCGAVCSSWQAIIKRRRSRIALELPWLMLCPHYMSRRDHRFLSLSDHWKVHKLPSPISNPISYKKKHRVDCAGSIEGWLIMIYRGLLIDNILEIEYFFWNPISGARVKLPSSQSNFPCHCENWPGFIIQKLVASSVPTTRSSQLHPCFVVSLCKLGHLAFCSPTDKSWTSIDAEGRSVVDVEIMNGKLYAVAVEQSEYFILRFDIIQDGNGNGNGNGGLPHPRYRVEKLVILLTGPAPPFDFSLSGRNGAPVMYVTNKLKYYLAVDPASAELFVILRKVNFAYNLQLESENPLHYMTGGIDYFDPPETKGFQLFKLECNNGNGVPGWVEVVDLGDRVLFVSEAGNKFISTNNGAMDYDFHSGKVERNCIYFAFDNACLESPSKGRDFGVFSMTNHSIRPCITFPESPDSFLNFTPKLPTRPVWFIPNP